MSFVYFEPFITSPLCDSVIAHIMISAVYNMLAKIMNSVTKVRDGLQTMIRTVYNMLAKIMNSVTR
jgi:hypothetical protein